MTGNVEETVSWCCYCRTRIKQTITYLLPMRRVCSDSLTVALSQRRCRLPVPAQVHLGSSGLSAAASGRTAASGRCTDRGRTSPAGRTSQVHHERNQQPMNFWDFTHVCDKDRSGRHRAGDILYLLHGENIFGGSRVLQQRMKLSHRTNLNAQTGEPWVAQ